MQKNKIVPIVMIAGGLLFIGAAIVFAISMLGSSGNQNIDARYVDVSGPYPEISRVRLDNAKEMFDSEEAVFLDVRSKDAFESAHIPGALHMEEAEIDSHRPGN